MLIQRLRPLFSGQGVQVEGLCREFARRHVHTTIVTAGHGPNERWEQVDGYRIRRLRADIPWVSRWLRPGRFRNEVFGLRAFLWLLTHGWRTELIHFHAASDALYTARLFAHLRRRPFIFEMTLLGADDPLTLAAKNVCLGGLRRRIFASCDGFVAISPALARAYAAAGLPAEKLRLIPQGVDTDQFRPIADKVPLRNRLGLRPAGPIVAFVGSLIERKGIDTLLAAWATIHAAVPEASLLLVGVNEFNDDPSAAAFLRDHLTRVPGDARDCVIEVGPRDNVREFLQAADVFAFPSRREGFGTAMIEAMACGLPCVVTDLPDITRFIYGSPPAGAVVVDRNDGAAMADSIVSLLADPEASTAMGEAGRRRVNERFSMTRVADDYLEFYAELTGSSTSAGDRRIADE